MRTSFICVPNPISLVCCFSSWLWDSWLFWSVFRNAAIFSCISSTGPCSWLSSTIPSVCRTTMIPSNSSVGNVPRSTSSRDAFATSVSSILIVYVSAYRPSWERNSGRFKRGSCKGIESDEAGSTEMVFIVSNELGWGSKASTGMSSISPTNSALSMLSCSRARASSMLSLVTDSTRR